MQNPAMNLKIEMFGNLIEELNKWHTACDNEEGDEELQYCEQMFVDTLSAVRDMREMLLEDFNEYKVYCRTNQVPLDISYARVERQLKESTFSLVGV